MRLRASNPAVRVLCFPVSAGASGSGQQVQGQGQAAKVVIAERRQVIKAALRGLVEAALPDLSPAQVDAVVAEVNKRTTMGSKQCVLAAVLCLAVLLQSFLGQPTQGFPAAGPAPGPPPPPDPACPPYAHPRLATRNSPHTAAAPAQLPPPVQLGIWDPQLLVQIRDAMELLTKASVLEHLMRGPHHRGIRLLPGEAHILALKVTWGALWEEYLRPRWRRQRLGLHHAQEHVIEAFCKKVVNGMKWVSRHHYHQERGVAVYLGAGKSDAKVLVEHNFNNVERYVKLYAKAARARSGLESQLRSGLERVGGSAVERVGGSAARHRHLMSAGTITAALATSLKVSKSPRQHSRPAAKVEDQGQPWEWE
ncbi:hypothetical protein QJQ45_011604 [Haematococcus lacustris]|nr:hypothetical protein QJQ45_011604 [Haematococcus lacustris]